MKLVDHWFWSAFAEHKNIYYKVILAASLINFMSVGSSIFIMVVYDRVVPNSAYESLYALTLGMALIMIAHGLTYGVAICTASIVNVTWTCGNGDAWGGCSNGCCNTKYGGPHGGRDAGCGHADGW